MSVSVQSVSQSASQSVSQSESQSPTCLTVRAGKAGRSRAVALVTGRQITACASVQAWAGTRVRRALVRV